MAIYAATQAFTFDENGVPRVFTPGTPIEDTDPGFKGREHLFEPVEDTAERRHSVTETATAAPGEVRTRRIGRPRKHQPEPVTPEHESESPE